MMVDDFDLDLSNFLPPLPSPTVSDDFPISPVPEVVDPSLLNLAVLQSLFLQQQQQQQQPHNHHQQQQQQHFHAVVAPLTTVPSPPQHDDLDQFVKFEQEQQQHQHHQQQQQQTPPPCAMTAAASPASESAATPNSTDTTTSTTNTNAPTADTNTQAAAAPKQQQQQQQQRPARQLECFNCHVTKTPLWRRTPDRAHSLCNACGLYYKQYGTHRPLHIRQKTPSKKIQQQQQQQQQAAAAAAAQQQAQHQHQQLVATVAANLLRPLLQARCANCFQTHTPLWRKNERGEPLCNACDYAAATAPTITQKPLNAATAAAAIAAGQKRVRDWDAPDETTAGNNGLLLLPPNKKQALSEMDDTRFKGLLSRMNKEQMHGFLEMLERRCAILRNVLSEEEKEQQQCS